MSQETRAAALSMERSALNGAELACCRGEASDRHFVRVHTALHLYMSVTVEADPRALENVPEKPLAFAVPRLQDMASVLPRYGLGLKHKPTVFLQESPTAGQGRRRGGMGNRCRTRVHKYPSGKSERSREQ